MFSFIIDVKACADIVPENARKRDDQFGIPKACSVEELLADPEIEIVLNLTNPWAHYEVNMAALKAGKHVYVEKPLAMTRQEAKNMIDFAKSRGLLIGCAPDTFLGAGLQTCRKLIDDGWIGKPIAANAMIMMAVSSEIYHKAGVGGALFDMGPYFITALVSLLGPMRKVKGSAQMPFPEKTVYDVNHAEYGKKFKVEVATTVSGVLEFDGNVIANFTATCDGFRYWPRLEIMGTEGVLVANDPNMFSDPVYVQRRGGEMKEMPLINKYDKDSRGLGLVDMAYAILNNKRHRANEQLAYHVLDVLHGLCDSSRSERYYRVESDCVRPEPFVEGSPF
ncbi:Gfo/Idh/MocA family protein [Caldicoprobacter algeriensis]|uniref:Gfo/Idh/MocA family protein n=1 Tax=Caldicoprobacter algeriensis TaxID=699281 RepID=UPI00207ACBD6|nr:Gfo/Idh/MocA family oxidoreductase [Caldicoprobacter algeriensis]